MRRLCFLTLVVFLGHMSIAQNAKYHSEIVFRLAKHIEWPEKSSDYKFIIGIVGNSQDYYEFQSAVLEYNRMTNRPVEVRYFNCTDDINSCDLIYISRDCSIDINKIIKKTKNEPIVIISGKEGYGKAGSLINFVDYKGKLKFELNQKQAERRGFVVSDDLKKLAILI